MRQGKKRCNAERIRILSLIIVAFLGVNCWSTATARESQNTQLDETTPEVEMAKSPEEGGPRNWTVAAHNGVNLRSSASTSSNILAALARGRVLDNLGCMQAGGRTWCDVQPFGGGPRGYVAAEFLMPTVSPDGSVAKGVDDSALRAGQNVFDATGTVPCARQSGQPTAPCQFGVARAGGGYATVVVTHANGTSRALFFRLGIPTGANTSEADGYPEFSARKRADLNLIFVGRERYEIPDAVVVGG